MAPAAFSEVLTQPLRVGARVGEGYVAVRPHEIQRTFLQTGASRCVLPRENVERKPMLSAGFPHPASRFSIHMDLPLQRF
jgi:hypothetical protein